MIQFESRCPFSPVIVIYLFIANIIKAAIKGEIPLIIVAWVDVSKGFLITKFSYWPSILSAWLIRNGIEMKQVLYRLLKK